MIATSIEQSIRLLNVGIDPQTADMCWAKRIIKATMTCIEYGNGFELYAKTYNPAEFGELPAWSLSALVLLLPEHIFYRIARASGKDLERLFEDCVKYLCMKSDDQKRHMMATL